MYYSTRKEKIIILLALILLPAIALPLFIDPIIAIVLYIGCIGAAFILFNPILGLLIMIFLVPIETMTLLSQSVTLGKAVGLLTGLAWLIHHQIMSRKPLKTNNIFWVLLIFAIWAWASTLWSIHPHNAVSRFTNLALLVGLYFLMINLVDSRKQFNLLLSAYILGCIVCGLWATKAFLTGGLSISGDSRMSLEGQNPNTLGLMMSICIISSWYLFIELKNHLLRLILLPLSMFFFLVLILSQSRGAWLAFLIALVFYFWPIMKKFSLRNVATLIFIALSLVTVLFFVLPKLFPQQFPSLQERFSSIFQSEGITPRTNIWLVGIEMWKDNPILGVGLNDFKARFNQYRDITSGFTSWPGKARDPHSVYLSIICELGLVGFAIFSALLFSCLTAIKKKDKFTKFFMLSIFVIILIVGMKGTINWNKYYWFVLGLIGASSNFGDQSDQFPNTDSLK